jgi:hypothetical protein
MLAMASMLTSATLNSLPATIMMQNATAVVLLTPAGSVSGPATLTLQSPAVFGTTIASSLYAYNPGARDCGMARRRGADCGRAVPQITSVTPGSGESPGGYTVTIRGLYLAADAGDLTAVALAGWPAANFTFVNASFITAVAAAIPVVPSTGLVVVTSTAFGTALGIDRFFYLPGAGAPCPPPLRRAADAPQWPCKRRSPTIS